MQSALVVLGHPNPGSFSHALGNAYAGGLRRSGVEVRTLELSELKFDPILRSGFGGEQALESDLLDARDALEAARLVGWFFPTWWAGPPALVSGFIERTFLPGWAFRYRAGASLPTPLLKGRYARVVTSMDSPSWWYRFWHRRALHASFVNATLRFCGFAVRSTTLFKLREWSDERRRQALAELEVLGFRDGTRLSRRTQRSLPPKPRKLPAVLPPIAR
ncbi:MAG: NAD(P)H-dependent oxidoreductase [Polyangiaceae bacterium]|nr:NAD(P)H-dependent oxidoreductase [Myxococcales bacterium]MCB9586244.1 NAD(P)H-dependent oxidoreductase [Polyangiaceae bacterium]MCB9606921.1 NAD(P)H-dependent oxidoreductase [Polyangiaceae bacterium]